MACDQDEEDSWFQLRRVGPPATCPDVRDIMRLQIGVVKFGRAASNNFYLDSRLLPNFISRYHAEVHGVKNDKGKVEFVLYDKGLNGTFINDIKMQSSCVLELGDKITFGHTNGYKLSPGEYSRQPHSEFQFVFERVSRNRDIKSKNDSSCKQDPRVSSTTQPFDTENHNRSTRDKSPSSVSSASSSSDSSSSSSASSASSNHSKNSRPTTPHLGNTSAVNETAVYNKEEEENDKSSVNSGSGSFSDSDKSSDESSGSSSSNDEDEDDELKDDTCNNKKDTLLRKPQNPPKQRSNSQNKTKKGRGRGAKASAPVSKPFSPPTVNTAKRGRGGKRGGGVGGRGGKRGKRKSNLTRETISTKDSDFEDDFDDFDDPYTFTSETSNSDGRGRGRGAGGAKRGHGSPRPTVTSSSLDQERKRKGATSSGDEAKKPKRGPGPGRGRKKKVAQEEQGPEDGVVWYDGEVCDHQNCKRPDKKGKKPVEWVQCDYCDKWYHTACVNCKYDQIKDPNIKYNCGCEK